MITDEEALAWAVREGINRAGGSVEDLELFKNVTERVHKIITEPPPPPTPKTRRDTPTFPTIKVAMDQKAVLIALTLLMGDDQE
jgi:hypothetical protein